MANLPNPYKYLTLAQAQAALALRLSDVNNIFWTAAELTYYIVEALREWNAITGVWAADYLFNINTPGNGVAPFINLSTAAGSPRPITLTDQYLITLMQYHLLEPPNGNATWTGTSQFSLPDLEQALQRRQDEVILLTNYLPLPLTGTGYPIVVTANQQRVLLGSNVLEARRATWTPVLPANSTPLTLRKEDPGSIQRYSRLAALSPQTPKAYSVTSQPPLTLDLNYPPNTSGTLAVMALIQGTVFAPPAATLLSIPDDWAWVLKWGALSDMLSKESEARDEARAKYCLDRYTQGLDMMRKCPWILQATVNGYPVYITGIDEMDNYSYGWQYTSTARPSVVEAGMDSVVICPPVTQLTPVVLRLVQSAPVPAAANDFVQASGDTIDVILDEAQHLASFKQGGSEFADTAPLHSNFLQSAILSNSRLAELGIFNDTLKGLGHDEEAMAPRFKAQ